MKRVVLLLEYIRLDIENCEESLSVYEGANLLEADMIDRLCSRVLLYDSLIPADWNTMSIDFDRHEWARASTSFRRPTSTFAATYRGVQLTMDGQSRGVISDS